MNDIKLQITDSNLDDKIFTINKNINFKTLYQELAENNKHNLNQNNYRIKHNLI